MAVVRGSPLASIEIIPLTAFTMSKNLSPKNSNDKRIVNRQEAAPATKSPKRENTFSKSRDVREDRSLRQMKNNKIRVVPVVGLEPTRLFTVPGF
jgi:hypothetical protein